MPEPIPSEVRAARTQVSRLTTERNRLLRDAARTGVLDKSRLREIDDRIGGVLDDVIALIDPCDASPDVPLVLLPVRLETRYGMRGQQARSCGCASTRTRIRVDDLTRGLTSDETSAGRLYWTSVWTDPVPSASWPSLVETVGADRAEWVAHVLTPTNLAERGTAPTPTFPTPVERGPRNVVARSLPTGSSSSVQGGQVSRAVGRPVPPDLGLSPIPLAGDEPERIANALAIPPGSEWLVDYDAALEKGMAVTVDLAGGAGPIERVIAVGTRASLRRPRAPMSSRICLPAIGSGPASGCCPRACRPTTPRPSDRPTDGDPIRSRPR